MALLFGLKFVNYAIPTRLRPWNAWKRGEMFTEFWMGGAKGRDHWEDLGIGGRISLRWEMHINLALAEIQSIRIAEILSVN
jgi:hypothetical protein